MDKLEKILMAMKNHPQNIRYADLLFVCRSFFGAPRQSGSSHTVFKTPWQGDPRINIQQSGNLAKAYQVRQVLQAIEKLKGMKR